MTKTIIAALALAALTVATSAQASELTDKISAYVPVVAVLSVCELQMDAASTAAHADMLKQIERGSDEQALLGKLINEAHASYFAARANGHAYNWCKNLVASSKGIVKFRTFAAVAFLKNRASPKERAAFVSEVCARGPKATGKIADEAREHLAREYKYAREDAIKYRYSLDLALDGVTDWFCTDMAS